MHLLFESDKCAGEVRRRAIWHHLKEAALHWRSAQQARAAKRKSILRLADMEDWQLRDLGFTRADVEHALRRNGASRELVECVQPY